MSTVGDLRKKVFLFARDDIFKDKGGTDVNRLSDVDMKDLFDAYDEIFFSNEIQNKLERERSTIEFLPSGDLSNKPSETVKNGRAYTIKFYPKTMRRIFNSSKNLTDAAGVGVKTMLGYILLTMEHEIMHLIMFLWKDMKTEEEHGKTFGCVANELFGHTLFDHDLGLTPVRETQAPKRKLTVYRNIANSCYLDSLLVVMLQNFSNYWRSGILDTDPSQIDYPPGICDVYGGSKITPDKVQAYAENVQLRVKEDMEKFAEPQSTTLVCSSIRKVLAECLPQMGKEGHWKMYNPSAVYDIFAGLFPPLKMNIPFEVKLEGKIKKKNVPLATVTMTDFMEKTDTSGDEYTKILWNEVNTPALVFQNTLSPRVKKFGEMGVEHTKTQVRIGGEVFETDFVKERAFRKTILGDRYTLVGVVMARGVPPEGEGGSHYNAYFLNEDEEWMFYDDMGVFSKTSENLPREVWNEIGSSLPELYFYVSVPPSAKGKKVAPKAQPKIVVEETRAPPTSGGIPQQKVPSTPTKSISSTPSVAPKKIISTPPSDLVIKRVKRPDGYVLLFVADKTANKKYVKDLLKFEPTTKYTTNTFYWRLTPQEADDLEAEIISLKD